MNILSVLLLRFSVISEGENDDYNSDELEHSPLSPFNLLNAEA
jgi:hypothetical protein